MPSKLKKRKALELGKALKKRQVLNIYKPIVCIRRDSLDSTENKELEYVFLGNIILVSWIRTDK